jgi:hypothetical protein
MSIEEYLYSKLMSNYLLPVIPNQNVSIEVPLHFTAPLAAETKR